MSVSDSTPILNNETLAFSTTPSTPCSDSTQGRIDAASETVTSSAAYQVIYDEDMRHRLFAIWAEIWAKSVEEVEQCLHPKQLEAIQILYQKQDVILIARTGFGKSLIFQSLPLLRKDGIALLIYPLSALEQDQHQDISKLPGAQPFILDARSNTIENRKNIGNGEYTHILISPEIVVENPKFRDEVLMKPTFRQRLCLVAIDEMHMIEQWGKGFRKAFGNLGILRAHTPGVPWFGASATLDPGIYEDVKRAAGFAPGNDTHLIKMPVDRPDILINMQVLGKDHSKHEELKFLVRDPGTFIPKTIIYLERIDDCRKLRGHLKELFKGSGWTDSQLNVLIRTYHGELDEEQKMLLGSELTKPESKHRIFIATDALGMGVNGPDVARVIQWGTPRGGIRSLWQRAGRAARGKDVEGGEFICFFSPELRGPLLEDLLKDAFANNISPDKQSRKDAKRRSNLPQGLHKLFNTTDCYREVILDFFANQKSKTPYERGCCSNCSEVTTTTNVALQIQLYEHEPAIQYASQERQNVMIARLAAWSQDTFRPKYAGTLVARAHSVDTWLPKKVIKQWARYADVITDEASFNRFAEGWSEKWRREYIKTLVELFLSKDPVLKLPDAPTQLKKATSAGISKKRKKRLQADHLNNTPAPEASTQEISEQPVDDSHIGGEESGLTETRPKEKKQKRGQALNKQPVEVEELPVLVETSSNLSDNRRLARAAKGNRVEYIRRQENVYGK